MLDVVLVELVANVVDVTAVRVVKVVVGDVVVCKRFRYVAYAVFALPSAFSRPQYRLGSAV